MSDDRPKWVRERQALGEDVAKTVGGLQARLLTDPPSADAVAALAKLRRGIGREPGFDYTLDRYLKVPDECLLRPPASDSEATDAEHAKQAAVTLFALHQQSQGERMHKAYRGLGHAIADLAEASDSPDGVRRRFAALGTASSFTEALYHLRSLIVMLREKKITLDYGLLADDLVTLREPEGRKRVQAIWGREFFRRVKPATNPDMNPEEETTI